MKKIMASFIAFLFVAALAHPVFASDPASPEQPAAPTEPAPAEPAPAPHN